MVINQRPTTYNPITTMKKIIAANMAFALLFPLMFIGPREEPSLTMYLMKCIVPLMMVLVFSINYYKLIPWAMKRLGKHDLLISNAVLVLLCCTMLAGWHRLEFMQYHKEKARTEQVMPAPKAGKDTGAGHGKKRKDRKYFWVYAAIFDGLNLIFAIFVAYSIRSSEQINNLKKLQQEAEVARQQAELKGLRNQISPHFLLNTLNNIYALASISAERTQGAVMQLSRLLRHMLYDNQSEMVTLESEADFITSYIDLMKLRLAANVKIETRIDIDRNSRVMVAPLLFISLIENAFKHGVSSTLPCLISISLHEVGENIVCDIINSNHPKLSSDRSGHGIGLNLVQQRLEAIYPGQYEWTKGVEADGMYHSKITIPAIQSSLQTTNIS